MEKGKSSSSTATSTYEMDFEEPIKVETIA